MKVVRVAHCTGEGFQFTAVVGDIAASTAIIMSLRHHQKHHERHIQQQLGDVSKQLKWLQKWTGKFGDASREYCTCEPQKYNCLYNASTMHHSCRTRGKMHWEKWVQLREMHRCLQLTCCLQKRDGGENNLQPFSPTTIIVTIYNITDIATTTTIVEDSIIILTGCWPLTTL